MNESYSICTSYAQRVLIVHRSSRLWKYASHAIFRQDHRFFKLKVSFSDHIFVTIFLVCFFAATFRSRAFEAPFLHVYTFTQIHTDTIFILFPFIIQFMLFYSTPRDFIPISCLPIAYSGGIYFVFMLINSHRQRNQILAVLFAWLVVLKRLVKIFECPLDIVKTLKL